MSKIEPKIGQFYTKKEVTKLCRGGNPNASIGVTNLYTLWMCIDPEINPSFLYGPTPYGLEKDEKAYVCGNGPGMINSAYKVLEHKQEFPIFIKKDKKWLYIGNYKMYNTSAKKDDIIQYEKHAHKNTNENVAIFFLRRTDNLFVESFEEFPTFDNDSIKKAA
jgi:hypothetical protein